MTRGDIWWADFGMPFGSERGFQRPVLIIQDDAFNKSKIHTIIVIPLTTNLLFSSAPGNIFIGKEESGLSKDSVLVVSQLSALDKNRLIEYANKVTQKKIEKIEAGIKLILGIN